MTPKGANLQATDLLEISELSGTGYITKSITGQQIINAGGGGGSQNLQQVTDLGSETTNAIVVQDVSSTPDFYATVSPYFIDVTDETQKEKITILPNVIEITNYAVLPGYSGSFKISNISNARFVTLEFPDKPTGSYTIATTADIPSVSGFVPYTGATADVNLGTFHLDAAKGTFTHNGSTDTLTANHTSGSGIGLSITKGGANEGLKVNKTSGSGNAATIIGTLEATTLVKTGGTSSQFLMADGSVSTSMIPRVQSVASNATVTPTSANDLVKITAQAVGLTLANPTGTFSEGQSLIIRIKDNGTARAITYGSDYRAIGVTLPTTTVLSKTTYLGIIYNDTDTKWDVVGVTTQA